MENVLHSFVAESDPQQQITYEDFDQIGKLYLEELDIKWQMAMLPVRINRYEKKAGRKKQFNNKMQQGKQLDSKARYSLFKLKELDKTEEPKALLPVDSMLNWSRIMKVQAYKSTLQTLEQQKAVPNEVFDLSAPSIFDTTPEDVAEKPLYDMFVKAVGMHVVPPPITGTFMPPSNNPDIDDTQFTYGSKSTNYAETNSVSNDYVSCDNSDKSSDSETTGFASCVSSVKSSSSKTNEHLAFAPNSVAFQTMSETAVQQPSSTNDDSSFSFKDECQVSNDLGPLMEFQLPDNSQVVLRVPRRNNLYCFNLTDIKPERDVTSAKQDKSPRASTPTFTNETQLCLACNKGKQHKLSYKAITVAPLDHSTPPLVVIDDFSRGFRREYSTGKNPITKGVRVTKPHNKTPYELVSGKAFKKQALRSKPIASRHASDQADIATSRMEFLLDHDKEEFPSCIFDASRPDIQFSSECIVLTAKLPPLTIQLEFASIRTHQQLVDVNSWSKNLNFLACKKQTIVATSFPRSRICMPASRAVGGQIDDSLSVWRIPNIEKCGLIQMIKYSTLRYGVKSLSSRLQEFLLVAVHLFLLWVSAEAAIEYMNEEKLSWKEESEDLQRKRQPDVLNSAKILYRYVGMTNGSTEFDKIRTAAADLQSQNLRRSLKRPGADLEHASSKKSKSTEAPKPGVPADSQQPSFEVPS
ncbi:hypothetical protein Tco_0937070 [Tanacetum coccineum]|uniref:Uncharacterized protein n=1 Tax=Tanacetum coccineum TaxID=301880 RepID=A0ABQ5DD56_9ASTR